MNIFVRCIIITLFWVLPYRRGTLAEIKIKIKSICFCQHILCSVNLTNDENGSFELMKYKISIYPSSILGKVPRNLF